MIYSLSLIKSPNNKICLNLFYTILRIISAWKKPNLIDNKQRQHNNCIVQMSSFVQRYIFNRIKSAIIVLNPFGGLKKISVQAHFWLFPVKLFYSIFKCNLLVTIKMPKLKDSNDHITPKLWTLKYSTHFKNDPTLKKPKVKYYNWRAI